ncbi:hotdog family protein [Noviherbaspirillum saxi]|uniref:3-hydroxylacyl-ACP dehydratase n=1 Tax=Noviherbaspirillum saxi TaxID=2320863 RepID=A0A3A3FLV9_9BURK|nr:hotdog family protein [Noviherbaspirillum saxi]RJF97217.1 3-hydroxylacyl-ACP dehydratase [Noviherbaspirillum saxi]
MDMPDIRSLVPHSGAMVLLDRVVSVDTDTLCAEVEIRPDSLFCGTSGVGGWVGIEYMAQAIAAHAGHTARLRGEPVKIGFLLGSRRYQCERSVFTVGSKLRVHVACLLMAENGLGSFECRIDDQDGIAATASVSVFSPADVDKFLTGGME